MAKAIKKTIFYLFVTLILSPILSSCVGWSIWEDSIKVKSIVNGNTIRLENDINVVLLGLEDTQNSQLRLQQLLCPDGQMRYVWFTRDSSFPELYFLDEDNNTFYAYATTFDDNGNDISVNGLILREGLSDLCENPYLCDSLNQYLYYVEEGKGNGEMIVPNPVVKPVLDPELEDIVENVIYDKKNREFHDHSGDIWYSDGFRNCEMLDRAVDYTNSVTKSFANMLALKSEGSFNVGQICEIYSYLRNKWKYVNDPADNEYVAYASESIIDSHLSGDCDDFAVLMASCILAVGGEACINTAYAAGEGHAFAEVDVSRFQQDDIESSVQSYFGKYSFIPATLCYRRDGNRLWLNLDWQTAFPGGNYWADQQYTSWDSYVREDGTWTWKKLR